MKSTLTAKETENWQSDYKENKNEWFTTRFLLSYSMYFLFY